MLSTGCAEMSTWPAAPLEKKVFNLENANIKESPSPGGTKQGPPLPLTPGSSPAWDRSWSKGAAVTKKPRLFTSLPTGPHRYLMPLPLTLLFQAARPRIPWGNFRLPSSPERARWRVPARRRGMYFV